MRCFAYNIPRRQSFDSPTRADNRPLHPFGSRNKYGDMLVEGSGNFYLCEGYVGSGAHTYKYGPASNQIWQSTSDGQFREHWRLALNCVTNKVIVAGGGTTSPTLNIAEIDVKVSDLTRLYP